MGPSNYFRGISRILHFESKKLLVQARLWGLFWLHIALISRNLRIAPTRIVLSVMHVLEVKATLVLSKRNDIPTHCSVPLQVPVLLFDADGTHTRADPFDLKPESHITLAREYTCRSPVQLPLMILNGGQYVETAEHRIAHSPHSNVS